MIHPKAVIDKEVVLGEGVEIGAYTVVEKGVRLGDGVRVSPFVHLKGRTFIGDNTFIGTGAVIGEVPQSIEGINDAGGVYIGKNNVIREYVTIHSSMFADKATSLGDNNYVMAFSHVAHDCKLANNVVICTAALLAGHVEIQEKAFISGNVVVHQFVKIGELAMIGGLSRVNQDVLPFMMVIGDSRVWGINLIGLKRAGFSKEDISKVKKAYVFLYRRRLPIASALDKLKEIESDKVKKIIISVLASKRGICGPKSNSLFEKLFLDYPYFLRTKISIHKIFLKIKSQNIFFEPESESKNK